MQQELVPVELDNGEAMWAVVQMPGGATDVGWFGDLKDKVLVSSGMSSGLRWVVRSVRSGLDRIEPDEVTVEVGFELSIGKDGLVAALGGVSGKTAVKVTLKWNGNDQPSAEENAPDDSDGDVEAQATADVDPTAVSE